MKRAVKWNHILKLNPWYNTTSSWLIIKIIHYDTWVSWNIFPDHVPWLQITISIIYTWAWAWAWASNLFAFFFRTLTSFFPFFKRDSFQSSHSDNFKFIIGLSLGSFLVWRHLWMAPKHTLGRSKTFCGLCLPSPFHLGHLRWNCF